MRIHVLMSLIIVTMKVWTVTVTSPQLVHVNNCDLLVTPQFPHPFFLTLRVGTVLNPYSRPDILVITAHKHRIQGTYSKFGQCMNILYRNLVHYTAQNKNCYLKKP